MENKKVKNENYFQVNGWMINELHLKGIPLMVYAIIYGFSQDGETQFEGSRQYLCDFTGCTKPTIDKALNELIESNLIIKNSETKNSIIFNKYKVNLDMLNFTTGKETLLGGGKETLPNNNIIDNIDLDNNKNINNTDVKKKIEKEKNPIQEIYDYWNTKNIVVHRDLTEKRKKVITKALKEHSVDDIKTAIDHFEEMLHSKYEYCDYAWSLEEFLSREKGFTEFLNDGSKWINYLNWKKKQQDEKPVEHIGTYLR